MEPKDILITKNRKRSWIEHNTSFVHSDAEIEVLLSILYYRQKNKFVSDEFPCESLVTGSFPIRGLEY
jgi:hypothetical protein